MSECQGKWPDQPLRLSSERHPSAQRFLCCSKTEKKHEYLTGFIWGIPANLKLRRAIQGEVYPRIFP